MGAFGIVAGGLYCLMMMYGACALAVPYFAGETRRIPEVRLFLLGILLPVGVAFFSVFSYAVSGRRVEGETGRARTVLALLVPVSLAWLYLVREDADSGPRSRLRRAGEADLALADEALARDPGDALSHWSRARILESLERFEDAAVAFARAAALSERVLPPAQLAHHLTRLDGLERLRRERERRRSAALGGGRGGWVEAVFFAAGLCLTAWSVLLALPLCSYMLFVRWFRLLEEGD